jgi:hypothetical protein
MLHKKKELLKIIVIIDIKTKENKTIKNNITKKKKSSIDPISFSFSFNINNLTKEFEISNCFI